MFSYEQDTHELLKAPLGTSAAKTPKTLKLYLHNSSAMSASAAARSVFRSAAARTSHAARLAVGPKPRPATSPFRVSKPSPLSQRIFRSPVELSCCVETMLPYHTATASALLTSMLAVSRRSYNWTPEGLSKPH